MAFIFPQSPSSQMEDAVYRCTEGEVLFLGTTKSDITVSVCLSVWMDGWHC